MPLVRALNPANFNRDTPVVLFPVKRAIRIDGFSFGFGEGEEAAGQNPAPGATICYYLAKKPAGPVTLRFYTASGQLVKEISSEPTAAQKAEMAAAGGGGFRRGPALAPAKEGLNRFLWNMRYADATGFPGLLMWAGSLTGPEIVPGQYKVELTADGKTETQPFTVIKDPRAPSTPDDFDKQLALALKIRDRVSAADSAVVNIRPALDQLKPYSASSNQKVAGMAKDLSDQLTAIEESIYQTKLHADEDALNYPIKLNNKLAAVGETVQLTDVAPTAQSYAVFDELNAQLQTQLDHLHQIQTSGIANFNKLVRDQKIPAVSLSGAAE